MIEEKTVNNELLYTLCNTNLGIFAIVTILCIISFLHGYMRYKKNKDLGIPIMLASASYYVLIVIEMIS